ncbi:ATP synthase subunit a 2 [uncultured Desulfobacterium sp.]|uniref:ATP synthase subunit a n=1 Tax=uncultured Desulfobacterium sp. TaxID=201089 RepID=A0A445MZL2_9BACT|nr:ATP synthase subunit a 2 [uncultured Desulfobacterium sp.]
MTINPDAMVFFRIGLITVNATVFYTWVVMAILCLTSYAITKNLKTHGRITHWQSILESLYCMVAGQIRDVTEQEPSSYIPFLGTLFIFIFTANIMEVVPLYHPPTSSLSTTAALAVCVFFAVPCFAIMNHGVWMFLKEYARPSIFMVPFNILGEITRTISLAVRLFGNIMSESLIAGIFLMIVPLFVPVVMQVFGLVIGTVQAYIFFMLATVFIGSAAGTKERGLNKNNGKEE